VPAMVSAMEFQVFTTVNLETFASMLRLEGER
jgi:hypothetical protein